MYTWTCCMYVDTCELMPHTKRVKLIALLFVEAQTTFYTLRLFIGVGGVCPEAGSHSVA